MSVGFDTRSDLSPLTAAHLLLHSPPKTGSTATVSWDASQGKAPWTIIVAPINQMPVAVTIPTSYMSASLDTWTWNWSIPDYSETLEVIVAVSDASGDYAGVSALSTISAGSKSCTKPSTELDFIWYPPSTSPTSCSTWKLTWNVDRGNRGITPPVEWVLLPENGTPLTYAASSSDETWNMPVNWATGTNFVLAAFDQGPLGSGGVGDLYTVASGGKAVCSSLPRAVTQGLVKATDVASIASSSATSSRPSSSSSTRHSNSQTTATAASTGNDNASSSSSSTSSSSKGNTGTVAGAVVGAFAGFAVLGGLILWWWRRRGSSETTQGSDWPEVVPYKWEVMKEDDTGLESDDGHYQQGRGGHVAMDVSASASGAQGHVSKPSLSSRNVFSVVPDSALFPPLAPQQQQQHRPLGNSYDSVRHRMDQPTFTGVVPDSNLFPPPRPTSSNPGLKSPPVAAILPQGTISNDSTNSALGLSRFPETQERSTGNAQTPMTINPRSDFPVSTSIHDPYSHASQIYDDPELHSSLAYLDGPAASPPRQLVSQSTARGAPYQNHTRGASSTSSTGSNGAAADRLPPALYPGSRGLAEEELQPPPRLDELRPEFGGQLHRISEVTEYTSYTPSLAYP